MELAEAMHEKQIKLNNDNNNEKINEETKAVASLS